MLLMLLKEALRDCLFAIAGRSGSISVTAEELYNSFSRFKMKMLLRSLPIVLWSIMFVMVV